MPQIIVAADRGAAFGEGAVTFRERVNVTDFESGHFAAQLVERLGWAVEDADMVERRQDDPGERGPEEPIHAAEEPIHAPEPIHADESIHAAEAAEPVARRLDEPGAVNATV